MKKIDAGAIWMAVGLVASVIGFVAGKKGDDSRMDQIAEKAADILENRMSNK